MRGQFVRAVCKARGGWLMRRIRHEQAGMQTIEWLGLGLVVLALMGVMINFFGGDGGTAISELVGQKVKAMVNRMGPS